VAYNFISDGHLLNLHTLTSAQFQMHHRSVRLHVTWRPLTGFEENPHALHAQVPHRIRGQHYKIGRLHSENSGVVANFCEFTIWLPPSNSVHFQGKCSKTMGPVAILEKVEDSYAGCWQYYQIYAESLIEEGRTDTDLLYKTFKNCMEHCDLSNDEVRNIFG
jgi:hypothetical protein